ncbi:glutamate-5-semialdehyde dehydrogenase [Ciborinia camelliae]|nr:glutamate-5-semialdehyde dehydrogenase [Ciborinia camelliae]
MSLTNATPAEAASGAKTASHILATLPTASRNAALTAIHDALLENKEDILAANARDLESARKEAEGGRLSLSIVSRLDLGKKGKWEDMLKGILDVRDLEDPVGKVTLRTRLDDGLDLERVSCPIGVLLIIFEARPEVIANIASLAIKSGNAAILKGGKESTESFIAISTVISAALQSTEVPAAAIQLVTTRDVIPQLLALDQYIDLVIPRGSNELVRYIKENTKIPVMGHADGLCSIYLEHTADPTMATRVIVDSKTSYPAACNSVETLLVEQAALETVLPQVAEALLEKGVSLRCDASSKAALALKLPSHQCAFLQDAVESDFDTEHLSLILAIKTVSNLNEVISHINIHGSHHTDVILTSSSELAERFMAGVDSAGVFWNTSSRMADGMRFGFGTEVGISTNKIHARGPVGLEGLMIYKYKIRGNGQMSVEYGEGEGQKRILSCIFKPSTSLPLPSSSSALPSSLHRHLPNILLSHPFFTSKLPPSRGSTDARLSTISLAEETGDYSLQGIFLGVTYSSIDKPASQSSSNTFLKPRKSQSKPRHGVLSPSSAVDEQHRYGKSWGHFNDYEIRSRISWVSESTLSMESRRCYTEAVEGVRESGSVEGALVFPKGEGRVTFLIWRVD